MAELLQFKSALNRKDLLGPTVAAFLERWTGSVPAAEILVAPIDSNFTHSAQFVEHYGIDPSAGANCVIVEAVRGEKRALAVCVAPINTRMDINKVVRKTLDARRVSFAPLGEVVQQTHMEYGGVSPIGLPAGWPILIDSKLIDVPRVIVGSGIVSSKLSVPGKLLSELPGAIVVEGLGVLIES